MDTFVMQKNIMRRVYYSYALSIMTHTMFWQGIFLAVSAVLLGKWLHVASIVHNFLAVPVGGVPTYIANSFIGAITHGEVMTALLLVLAAAVTISCGFRLAHILFGERGMLHI